MIAPIVTAVLESSRRRSDDDRHRVSVNNRRYKQRAAYFGYVPRGPVAAGAGSDPHNLEETPRGPFDDVGPTPRNLGLALCNGPKSGPRGRVGGAQCIWGQSHHCRNSAARHVPQSQVMPDLATQPSSTPPELTLVT